VSLGYIVRYNGHMIVPQYKSEPALQEADILIRQKESGIGYHYGTVVRSGAVAPGITVYCQYPEFLAAHTMPGIGKHPDTIEGFFRDLPGMVMRPTRTEHQRA
jgi:hypothetical protein